VGYSAKTANIRLQNVFTNPHWAWLKHHKSILSREELQTMIYTAKTGQTSYGEAIGIILMESFMPFPPGCPGNASTFPFPVRYEVVKGANMERLVYQGDPELLQPFIDAGWKLVNEGVKAITGNCGFMVLYQDLMAKEFPVPVFMSSLLQLPFISRMLKPGEKVGIITANGKTLTPGTWKSPPAEWICPLPWREWKGNPIFMPPSMRKRGRWISPPWRRRPFRLRKI
jgi:hypothetical protein